MLALLLSICLLPGEDSAAAWLEKSINYHFPNQSWSTFAWRLDLEESRPGGLVRKTSLEIDVAKSYFKVISNRNGQVTTQQVEGDKATLLLNGSAEISDQDREKYRLTEERAFWIRNYYLYLYGLPAKLKDPGTVLAPEITRETYQGKEVVVLHISYESGVGDTFYQMYLDPETAALVGYRFWRKDVKSDGEFITCDGVYQIGEMRIPNPRTWFFNKNNREIGADTIVGHGPLN